MKYRHSRNRQKWTIWKQTAADDWWGDKTIHVLFSNASFLDNMYHICYNIRTSSEMYV
jgi:hypothetical protein